MSDVSVWITSGAGRVREFELKDPSGKAHKLHYLAKTPNEIALYFAADARYSQLGTPEGDEARQNNRAAFIASNMVTPDGKPMFTLEQAKLIPVVMKPVFISQIIEGSSSIEGVKKS